MLFLYTNDAWVALERGMWIAKDEHGFYPIRDDGGVPLKYVAD